MQHGIGTSTHGDIKCHRIHKGLAGSDIARQNAFVAILIVGKGVLHHLTGSSLKQFYAVGMGSQNRTIARQRESDSLRQRVHRIGGKHTRATTATRTSTTLYLFHFLVGYRGIGTLHHRRYEVGILTTPLTSLHGTTRTEYRRDVQSHRGHQHTWCHLIAVRDTDHRIGLVGIHHILHAVGNNVARRQRIEHTVVAHGDTVVDGDGVKLSGITTHLLNLLAYNLTYLMQVCMSWYKLGKRVHNGNNGLAKLLVLHASSHPQGSGSGHSSAFRTDSTSQLMFAHI